MSASVSIERMGAYLLQTFFNLKHTFTHKTLRWAKVCSVLFNLYALFVSCQFIRKELESLWQFIRGVRGVKKLNKTQQRKTQDRKTKHHVSGSNVCITDTMCISNAHSRGKEQT